MIRKEGEGRRMVVRKLSRCEWNGRGREVVRAALYTWLHSAYATTATLSAVARRSLMFTATSPPAKSARITHAIAKKTKHSYFGAAHLEIFWKIIFHLSRLSSTSILELLRVERALCPTWHRTRRTLLKGTRAVLDAPDCSYALYCVACSAAVHSWPC